MVNNIAKAREHLSELQKICLTPCDQVDDLKKKIDAHPGRQSAGQ
jgi:hypothetical protein